MAKSSASSPSASSSKATRIAFFSALSFLAFVGLMVHLATPVGGDGNGNGGSSPLSNLFARAQCSAPCVPGSEDIMKPKAHGTSEFPVGSPLFRAPMDRTWEDFIEESTKHGWPSFRDSEVDWEYARVLPGGEMVSIDGTHLGHNLPDKKGNRYCINLVSIAGQPVVSEDAGSDRKLYGVKLEGIELR